MLVSLINILFYIFFVHQAWMEKSCLSADKSKLRKLMEKVDHSLIEYEPFRKNFYIESTEISKLSEAEIER